MGCVKFGENWGQSLEDMIIDAAYEAFEDAGIGPEDIQAAWWGSVFAGESGRSWRTLAQVGLHPAGTHVESQCATGSEAIRASRLRRGGRRLRCGAGRRGGEIEGHRLFRPSADPSNCHLELPPHHADAGRDLRHDGDGLFCQVRTHSTRARDCWLRLQSRTTTTARSIPKHTFNGRSLWSRPSKRRWSLIHWAYLIAAA